MAVSSAQIVEFLLANPNMSDADIAAAMATYGVSPADLAKATGSDEGEIAARVAATLPPNEAVLLGDTYVQAVNTTTGSGEDQQVGGLENVITYKADQNKVGGDVKYYSPTGEYQQTTKQQEVDTSLGGLVKDLASNPLVSAALLASGLPAGIGEAVGLGTGAAATSVGTGLLNAGLSAATGADLKDVVKAGLVGGGASLLGSTVNDLISSGSTIDASGMTQAQLDASLEGQLVKEMQNAGLTNNQISAFLDDMGIGQGITTPATTSPTTTTPTTPTAPTVPEVTVTAPTTPVTPNLTGVINAISSTVPTVEIKAEKPKDTVTPSLLTPSSTVPEVTVTSTKPVVTAPTTPITPITPTVPLVLPTIPTPPTPPTPPAPPPDKTPTITDVIKTIAPLVLAPAVVNSLTPTKTTYPVVPVPPEWTTPTAQPTTPYQPLTPIDFGNRNLLIGTQWEKFLDPNYGKVPAPVQYTQPSNMTYSNLMDILGSKQGMPSQAGSLSINDIISGIQNQYGQAPSSAMGQKPA